MIGESETPPPTVAARPGCLFKALVTLVVLVVVLGGGGYLAYRYVPYWIVTSYTEAAPLDLGEQAASPAELGGLDGRIADFAHAARNKRPVDPLVLSEEDLTALVARSPDIRRVGGGVRLSIADGQIHGELSVPLVQFGYPDRWFNGSAAFAVALENGVLIVTLQSAAVRGRAIPGWIVDRLRTRNLAKDAAENAQTAAVIASLESIEFGDRRITLVPRARR